MTRHRIMVAGWFSFEDMGATAGDLLARDVLCSWLAEASLPYDIATAPPFSGGVTWQETISSDYTHVIFVCGPFGNGEPIIAFLEHFQRCQLIGLDLSMLQDLDEWNPFSLLLERDSSRTSRPDLSFLAEAPKVPVVGLLLVHPQAEYGDRGRHHHLHRVIQDFLDGVDAAVVPIDTRLDSNAANLRSPSEVESLIARMDLVVTTRLHGMVLALKNGVPAVVVDPIEGGAKVARQARAIGWPILLTSETADVAALRSAYDYCLESDARALAGSVAYRARLALQDAKLDLLAHVNRCD